MSNRAKWMKDAGWGLMFHYLASPASYIGVSDFTPQSWNEQVNNFDVKGFAEQVAKIGAGYVFFTLGQNSGFYCSPNATYDSYVQHSPSWCSERDLLGDISLELAKKGVRTVAYLPSGAPEYDDVAISGLSYTKQSIRQDPTKTVSDRRMKEFQIKWENIIREWALRYGKQISGWWIDGAYFPDDMYRFDDAPNFASFADALRAGNPDAAVAFNPGVKYPIRAYTPYEDYTAGEVSDNLPVGAWGKNGCQPYSGMLDGDQFHVLTYSGANWGRGKPRFTRELICGYTQYINEVCGGAVTWDVPVSKTGHIDEDFLTLFPKR